MITNIYVPCEIFKIEVTIGPRDRLSPLEQLLLEAVAAGVSAFEDLVDLFHLGTRPTIDLVLDLWRRGYLIVDPHSGSTVISERVRECLGPEGKLRPDGFVTPDGREIEPLHAVECSVRKFLLQQELLSPQGHVLRVHRRPTRFEGVRIAPTALAAGSLRRASRQEITSIIEYLLTQERRPQGQREEAEAPAGLEQRVLAIHFIADPTRPEEVPLESIYLEVRVDCTVDAATGAFAFRILHPTSLPRRVCTDMERSLADLADKLPDHAFFRSLRQADSGEVAGVPDLAVVLASLRQEVGRLSGAEAGTAEGLHDALQAQAAEAQDMVQEHVAGRARIRFLTVAEHIHEEVKRAIKDAREQLLLCGPVIDYDALASLLPLLVEAMGDRGVRVFLLWGLRDDASLPKNVVNRLDDLKKQYGDRLVYSREPARLGVRFVVKDADRVILSSHQFLRDPAGSFRELAAVVEATSDRVPLRAALDLLEYGRAGYPTSLATHGMETVAERFFSPRYVERVPAVPTSPEPPATSAGNDRYTSAALQIWRQAWSRHVEDLEQTVTRAGQTCRLIRDKDHRDALWGLLRRPGHRLVVLSRYLEPAVVNRAMGDLLEQRLSGGTRVVIGFSRMDRGAKELLEGLEHRYPKGLRLIDLTGAVPAGDIEALIGDDVAVVSSYPFLSASGYYDGRRRTRSEVGLLLRGGDVADLLLRELARRFDALRELVHEEPAPPPPRAEPIVRPAPAPGLQGLLARIDQTDKEEAGTARLPRDQARELRQYFESLPTGTAAGEALRTLEVSGVPELPMVAACCLATRPWDEPGVRRGFVTLIHHDWYERGDPYTALILLPFVDVAPADLPPLWVARLKAARHSPALLEQGLDQATMNEGFGRHATSFACVAISALLLDGVELAAAVIELTRDRFPAPLAAWADAAIQYHRASRGRPLPLAELRAIFLWQQERDAAHLVRTQLGQALGAARTASFRFPLGQFTWDFLFGEHGAMGRLDRLLGQSQSDHKPVRDWLRANRDVDQMLDQATEAIWERRFRDRRIFHPKRMPLVGRLKTVVDKARDWVARSEALAQAEQEDSSSADLVQLARSLQQGRDAVAELQQTAFRDRRPEAPLLKELVGDLRPLLEVPR